MKTTTYKVENVMRSLVASLIILASFSGIANAGNSNKKAIGFVNNEPALAVESRLIPNEYNAKEFVEADLALETGNWINSNDETNNKVAEPDLALQVADYSAKEFVEAEMAVEIKSWLNDSSNCIGSENRFYCSNELDNN